MVLLCSSISGILCMICVTSCDNKETNQTIFFSFDSNSRKIAASSTSKQDGEIEHF